MELFEALEQENREGGVDMTRRAKLDGLPPIKVVGVGGGGCNAVNRMVQARIAGVEFVGVNTRSGTRLNSSHITISYAVFCLKKKKKNKKKNKKNNKNKRITH